MAKMWPEKIPADILSNPQRSAECKTFRRFERELEDPFVVFYSRPWFGVTPNGEEIDGECDFVVAHPELGMLAIEVKGGQISYNPSSDQWMTRDRWGFDHVIKNPFFQAKSSKYQILKKLNKSPLWNSRRIQAVHGVIFPDTEDPGKDLGADMPEEMICYLDTFEGRFRNYILGRLHDLNEYGSRRFPLGEDGMNALEDLLARPFQLHVPIGHILAEDDRQLQVLTQRQFHILNIIGKIPRAAISGGAGTGKTVLAIEESVRSAKAGQKVLFTCYNRPLAEEMRRRIRSSDRLHVMNFHEFCWKITTDAGIEPPSGSDEDLFREWYPSACIRALKKNPELQYDTIIIDEGQDFLPLWLSTLDAALTGKRSGKMRVYFDSNQRLYGNTEKNLENFELVSIPLSDNIRNTKKIHEAASCYYVGDPVNSVGPEGREIEYITADFPVTVQRQLEAIILNLIQKERINPEDIAILADSKNTLNQIIPSGNLAGKRGVPCDKPEEDTIIIDSIRRFKGLESPVVILIVTPEVVLNEELLYVAISRARTHLCIIGEKTAVERIRDHRKLSL